MKEPQNSIEFDIIGICLDPCSYRGRPTIRGSKGSSKGYRCANKISEFLNILSSETRLVPTLGLRLWGESP